jgi:hypothetical protein
MKQCEECDVVECDVVECEHHPDFVDDSFAAMTWTEQADIAEATSKYARMGDADDY